jgi:hypothetical protein
MHYSSVSPAVPSIIHQGQISLEFGVALVRIDLDLINSYQVLFLSATSARLYFEVKTYSQPHFLFYV